MIKEFIPYDQALLLKELGFNDECIQYYAPGHPEGYYLRSRENALNNTHWMFVDDGDGKGRDTLCTAPLYQQAFRWFREKYSINSWIINAEDNNNAFKPFFRGNNIDEHLVDFYNTYEEAEQLLLKTLIKILKEQILNQNK